jgi:16S rRNA (cytosine967-C5)-methyltransferase
MHPSLIAEQCTDLLGALLRFEHPADAVVSRWFREHRALGMREGATLAEAVYCVLRFKPRFEHFASWFVGAGDGRQTLRCMALLGLRQATTLPLAAAARSDELAWLARCAEPKALADLPQPLQHNLPTWLANALRDQYGGEDFVPLAQSLLESAPLDLRVNTLKAKRDQVYSDLRSRGIGVARTHYAPNGLRLEGKPSIGAWPEFQSGAVEVQDEGSQLLAELVAPRRGEMVVDFCAGAGGKTLALGALMRNTGRLYAFDTSARRLDKLGPRLARSGLSNVTPVVIEHERDARIKRLAGKIDRVLVDAPCSGLGTLRRNPDLKWRHTPKTIDEMVAKQQAILAAAAGLLRPGGRLVYATCSLLRRENEQVVERFLAEHEDFLGEPVETWARGLGLTDQTVTLGLLPHRHHTDGFFAAVLVRKAAASETSGAAALAPHPAGEGEETPQQQGSSAGESGQDGN